MVRYIRRYLVCLVAAITMLAPFGTARASAASPTINQYPLPTCQDLTNPHAQGRCGAGIPVNGPNGTIWFIEGANNSIAQITTSGQVSMYSIPTSSGEPSGLTVGPDGNLWFTESTSPRQLGRITPSGTITMFSLPAGLASEFTTGMVAGPDGNLWAVAQASTGNNYILQISTSGTVLSQYPFSPSFNFNETILVGPNGNLWFNDAGSSAIGQITTAGVMTEYALPSGAVAVGNLINGPDGNLWFTNAVQGSNSQLDKITTAGAITQYSIPNSTSTGNIVAGSDGNIWAIAGPSSSSESLYRLTTAGVATALTTQPNMSSLIAAPNGSLWWEEQGDEVGNINAAGVVSVTTLPSQGDADGLIVGPDGNIWTPLSQPNDVDQIVIAQAPAAPTGLTAPSLTNQSPVLSWNAVPAATFYNIYRNGSLIDTIGSNNTSYTDHSAPEGNNSYYVTAKDSAGESGPSNSVSVYYALLLQAVNAGGNATGSFAADTGGNGGQTYSTNASIDMSQVTAMQAPQAVYQSVRYGNSFSYTLPSLTPGANYTVRLHFSEPYWGTTQSSGIGGIGSRVFDVAVNGQAALTNFDVYRAAGGSNRAITEDVPTTADSNGNVTVQFTADTDNAMVSGIELYDSTLPTEPAYQIPNPITSEQINAGGSTAGSYAADTEYNAGQTYASTASVDTSGVANPAPQAVYQSVRYGNFSYELHNLTPSSSYTVRLQFNEPYYGVGSNGGGVGSRIFNVAINGSTVLNNFDVYQIAGAANTAVEEDFTAQTDTNGNLVIRFSSVAGDAMVSGIDVQQQ